MEAARAHCRRTGWRVKATPPVAFLQPCELPDDSLPGPECRAPDTPGCDDGSATGRADDRERANKPSSVPAAPGRIISLGYALLRTSSSLPGTRSERAAPRPCLALLRVGFTVRLPLPGARCALTAPFHPCLCTPSGGHRRSVLCGTFHRLTPPGGYPAPCPAELGLSSDEGCTRRRRSSLARSRIRSGVYGRTGSGSIGGVRRPGCRSIASPGGGKWVARRPGEEREGFPPRRSVSGAPGRETPLRTAALRRCSSPPRRELGRARGSARR